METPQDQGTTGIVNAGDAAPTQVTTPPNADAGGAAPLPPAAPAADDTQKKIEGLTQAAKAEREKRQEVEAQLLSTQVYLMQVAQQQQRQQPAAPPAGAPAPDPADPLASFSDTDLLDPAKVRAALREVHRSAVTTAQQSVAEAHFLTQYQDFGSVVGSTNPVTGQFAPSDLLTEAMQENPGLSNELIDMGQRDRLAAQRYAYRMALQQKRMRELRTAATAPTRPGEPPVPANLAGIAARNASATADALTAPMSPASVSGTSAQTTHSDEYWRERLKTTEGQREFDNMMDRARRGEFG